MAYENAERGGKSWLVIGNAGVERCGDALQRRFKEHVVGIPYENRILTRIALAERETPDWSASPIHISNLVPSKAGVLAFSSHGIKPA